MEFNEYTLKDISLNITDGVHNTVIDDPAGDCFLLSCKNIKDYHIIISAKERTISHDTLLRLRNRTKTEKDDILITSVGTIGELSLVKDENPNYEFQRSVAIIKPNKLIVIPEYLMYSLKYEMPQINKFVKGAVQKCLFINDLKQIVVKLPSLANQKKIVQLLMSIDRKIELNNQINNNLHEILSILYKSWFENFDNFKYQKFKKTEIGNIPNNFDVIELNDLINIRGGLAYKASKLSDNHSDNILVSMGNVELNKMFNFNNLKYYSEDAVDKYVAETGDLFICTRDVTQQRNQLGCPGLIPKLFENKKVIIGTNLYIVNYKKIGKILNKYMFLLLNSSSYRKKIVGSAKGTAVLMIAKDDILKFKFPFPKSEIIIDEFNKIITPLFELIENNICENNKLEQLRDTLLPKLMNGEIDLDNIKI